MRLFLEKHLFTLLREYELTTLPLDRFLRRYFHAHRSLGAQDRRTLVETIYEMIRWKGRIDHFGMADTSWEKRYATWATLRPFQDDPTLPLHVRTSCPEPLLQRFMAHFGEEASVNYAFLMNEQAPTTIRVNPLKTTRDELFNLWKERYPISLTRHSALGITFHKRVALFSFPEFKEGLFEIQDEGSQLVADLAAVQPGDEVLDFCAGSGGKALAIAPKLSKKGQLYLHDVRENALLQAKERCRRAGIENAQLLSSDAPYKNSLKKRMEWVIADVPCSGSGTFRRNPEMKWAYSDETLERLVQKQRSIVKEALEFLKPGGKLLYATCSLLPEENEEQISYFEEKLRMKLVKPALKTKIESGGMDGFFAAVLTCSP